ncbi:uncharacterized protein LOC129589469 [Paramacrobiotus metropolitanus]|uniref:uncharacterized protein LOC129589469 n=1 Tax=Paramacrobiotus metropolitanus TaxID=2943436 RepID=UPI002445F089|nr:uncharacterized protein LOC129589469 [Paramacrobiotus metropolitanus]
MFSGQRETSMAEIPEDIAVVVEVRGRDGIFQCGKVVAASSSGLLVDFRCTDRRNEWVPLDQASMYWDPVSAYSYPRWTRSRFYADQVIMDSVEVLMQHSPAEPWKWHPATILVYDRQHNQFAWVKFHLSGRDVKAVVPRDRIRRCGLKVLMTYGLLELVEERKMETFNLENRLFYNKTVLSPLAAAKASTTPKSVKQHGPEDGCRVAETWWKGLLACCGRSTSPALKIVPPAPVLDEGRAFRVLPVEIITETLYSLPTVDQCRLRTVCTGWNRLLTAAAVRNLLHIHFPSKSECSSSAGSVYIAVACAHRCWSSGVVGIVGSPARDNCNEKLSINYLPLCDGLFLRALMNNYPKDLVLKDINCMYIPDDRAKDYIVTFHRVFDSLAAVGDKLTVKNFTCEIFQSVLDGGVPFTIRIPFGRMRDWCLTLTGWWRMIEQGCPRLNDKQKGVVRCAIRKRHSCSAELQENLKMIIWARQTNNPRKSVTYLKPSPAGPHPLDFVDVNRLTRLAQNLMYCAITKATFNCTVTWPAA